VAKEDDLPEAEQSLEELNELTSHLLSQMEQTLQKPLVEADSANDLESQ